MLNLIQTEFLKLRRKNFIFLMMFSSLLMPVMAVFYFGASQKAGITPMQFYKWSAYSYTSWIILPVVLGILGTMFLYDENQNNMLKQLWIIPISKLGYFLSKFFMVFLYSVLFMIITAGCSILAGILPGTIPFTADSVSYLFMKCLEIGVLAPFALLPVLAVAASQKGYILPVCVTLVYTFFGFILLMVNMYVHPLSSMTAIVIMDMPDVVMKQPIDLKSAFLCIGVWGAASIICADVALSKRQ